MGNLYEYFRAADDDVAVTAFEHGAAHAGLAGLGALKGAEPTTFAIPVEALLTGLSKDEVSADPRSLALISPEEPEGPWVVSLTDRLRDGLAEVPQEGLLPLAERWCETEPDDAVGIAPESLADFLGRLAALAADAREREERLYCWMCL
ncbi:hypothetical protein [Spirillospora sp. NPDC047279]|uniref:hypothetical protein n=1 Tax=Spirillospora sp. NPDC047279 TaxID=3155478 RepID=UPI0033E90B8B